MYFINPFLPLSPDSPLGLPYPLEPLDPPELFTFNNPAGACSDCEGLGVKQYVDVAKVIHEPSASLSEGAIVGWDISHRYHFHLIKCLSRDYEFSLDEPFQDLDHLNPPDYRQKHIVKHPNPFHF